MALELHPRALSSRIDALASGWSGHSQRVLIRNQAYLRAFSPDFDERLKEHDQWSDPYRQETNDRYRSSFNVTRAVVELWASLEASEFPAIRYQEEFVPTPAPSADEQEAAARQQMYRAFKQVEQQRATMREQVLGKHLRRARAKQRFYQATLRKNVYGHSWVKTWPDMRRKTFCLSTHIDPSTVFPVWSFTDDDEGRLDAILVAYRRSAASVNAQFPGFLPISNDGISVQESGYYQPTQDRVTQSDLNFVWVEDYWVLDASWEAEPGAGEVPIRSRVVNATRINGAFPTPAGDGTFRPLGGGEGETPTISVHRGWKAIPYILFQNDNLRDNLGFSDAGGMLPFQDSTNRFMSQQQDVIHGESRPRFKYRGDADRQVTLGDDEVISLDPDEDIEQIQVHLDVFPTQIHGQQLADLMSRATGLPDTVWGRITAAQNSGRALATAWRAVAARLVPRMNANDRSIHQWLDMWLDWLELYGWDEAPVLFNGARDYELDFPNQEPRDFSEVSLDAINRMNAGILPLKKAMELTGDASPDQTLEEVRADNLDVILHPEKAQAYLLLEKAKQDMAIQAQQAGMEQAALLSQMQGAPGGPSTEQAAGAATQAQAQATAQAAPTQSEGQNAPGPATQQGASGNAIQTGTLVQDGQAFNRFIQKGEIG
jgi:hypothetical protein